jgi:hypothetical protein
MLKPPSKRGATDRLRAVLHDDDRQLLVSHTAGLTAGLVGWFVCSFFASVAYNWTFYYVLALIVAARELTLDRVIAARALERSSTKTLSVPSRRFSPQRRGARRSGGARQEFGP